MRGSWKRHGIVTDLVIDDSISNVIRELRNGLNTFIVSYKACGLDAVRFCLKFILNAIESTRKKSMGLNNEVSG